MSNLDALKQFKLRHTSVLTPIKLIATLLALALGTATATVHGQTVNDVLDAFKEVVKQSKNRPGKVGSEKRENAQVKRLQTALSGLGYYKGESDGIYGPGTDRALVDFLKDHGFQGPRPGEADALDRMVELAESELVKGSRASKNGQPDPDQEPNRDANWVATYAEARGGCSYFDQVLAGAPAADSSRQTGDPSVLFGKPVIDWIEADFNLLEQAYFSACGIRSGAADFEREQFRSSIIGNLKARIEQAKVDLAYQNDLEARKKQELAEGQAAEKLITAKLAELEPLIAACERQLTPSCFQTGSDALTTLKELTEAARLVKDTSTDYGTKIYQMESRALDIRAQGYEASKSQDTNASLINNCGQEIAGRKLSDPIFDLPIIWYNPANSNPNLRHFACYFHSTEVFNNLSEYSDGSVAFYIKEIRLDFVPTEISQKTGAVRYGIKKPVKEGGVLALVRVQNGLKVVEVNNEDDAIRIMGALVAAYATRE